jgi:hypothetical protein
MNGKVDYRHIKAVMYSSKGNNLLSVTDWMFHQLDSVNVAEMYDDASMGDMSASIARFRHGIREYKICPICHGQGDITHYRCVNQLLEVAPISSDSKRLLIKPERIQHILNVPHDQLGGEAMSDLYKNTILWMPAYELQVDIRDPYP